MANPESSHPIPPPANSIPEGPPPPTENATDEQEETMQDVPMPYILYRLRSVARHFWQRPETATCAIVFPVDPPSLQKKANVVGHDHAPPLAANVDNMRRRGSAMHPASTSDDRRGSAPMLNSQLPYTKMVLLHIEYLTTQSALFRSLFSASSHLDLSIAQGANTDPKLYAPSYTEFQFPARRTPRILPNARIPTVYLPLPDAKSLPHILHYLYWGDLGIFDMALSAEDIKWEDLVRNVEYLGLGLEMKSFLGRWWRSWVAVHGGPTVADIHGEVDDDSDDDDVEPDSDSDEDLMEEDDYHADDSFESATTTTSTSSFKQDADELVRHLELF